MDETMCETTDLIVGQKYALGNAPVSWDVGTYVGPASDHAGWALFRDVPGGWTDGRCGHPEMRGVSCWITDGPFRAVPSTPAADGAAPGKKYDSAKLDVSLIPPEVIAYVEGCLVHPPVTIVSALLHIAQWQISRDTKELVAALVALADDLESLGADSGERMCIWEHVARVLEHGAKKYGRDNWRGLERARERYYAAALRHDFRSEVRDLDDEGEHPSYLPHLAHEACCVVFLIWFELKKP